MQTEKEFKILKKKTRKGQKAYNRTATRTPRKRLYHYPKNTIRKNYRLDLLPEIGFIGKKQLMIVLDEDIYHLRAGINDGIFPKPTNQGGYILWRVEDVRNYINLKISKYRKK